MKYLQKFISCKKCKIINFFSKKKKQSPISPSKTSSAPFPSTPISTTMNSVSWLSSEYKSPVLPSDNLLVYFKAGNEDLTEKIAIRVTHLLEFIEFSCDQKYRRELIAIRYYKLLELMLEQEEKRLKKKIFQRY